jgi:dTDP-4-dehydrorhamnose 3,5-epimerase
MNVTPGPIPGLLVFEPEVHADQRGHFVEVWHEERYRDHGLPGFVQDNFVHSRRGVIRGLHFQHPNGQAKLVWAVAGSIYDVVVDVRVGSPTFGQCSTVTISSADARQLFIPPGFAHGYQVVSDGAAVAYKCADYYRPERSRTVLWSDPDLAISWPIPDAILVDRDRSALPLAAIPAGHLPRYAEPPE